MPGIGIGVGVGLAGTGGSSSGAPPPYELTVGTGGTSYGYDTSPAFGALSPDTFEGITITEFLVDSANDSIRFRLASRLEDVQEVTLTVDGNITVVRLQDGNVYVGNDPVFTAAVVALNGQTVGADAVKTDAAVGLTVGTWSDRRGFRADFTGDGYLVPDTFEGQRVKRLECQANGAVRVELEGGQIPGETEVTVQIAGAEAVVASWTGSIYQGNGGTAAGSIWAVLDANVGNTLAFNLIVGDVQGYNMQVGGNASYAGYWAATFGALQPPTINDGTSDIAVTFWMANKASNLVRLDVQPNDIRNTQEIDIVIDGVAATLRKNSSGLFQTSEPTIADAFRNNEGLTIFAQADFALDAVGLTVGGSGDNTGYDNGKGAINPEYVTVVTTEARISILRAEAGDFVRVAFEDVPGQLDGLAEIEVTVNGVSAALPFISVGQYGGVDAPLNAAIDAAVGTTVPYSVAEVAAPVGFTIEDGSPTGIGYQVANDFGALNPDTVNFGGTDYTIVSLFKLGEVGSGDNVRVIFEGNAVPVDSVRLTVNGVTADLTIVANAFYQVTDAALAAEIENNIGNTVPFSVEEAPSADLSAPMFFFDHNALISGAAPLPDKSGNGYDMALQPTSASMGTNATGPAGELTCRYSSAVNGVEAAQSAEPLMPTNDRVRTFVQWINQNVDVGNGHGLSMTNGLNAGDHSLSFGFSPNSGFQRQRSYWLRDDDTTDFHIEGMGLLPAQSWALMALCLDGPAGEVLMSYNGNPWVLVKAATFKKPTTLPPLRFNNATGFLPGQPMDAGPAGAWDFKLSDAQLSWLYNGGAAFRYFSDLPNAP